MRISLYVFKNAQLLDVDVYILTPELPSQKVPEGFLVWFAI